MAVDGEKYSEARRRRIEMRRSSASAGDAPARKREGEADATDPPAKRIRGGRSASGQNLTAFGSVSLAGRTREMEDAVSVRPGFFRFAGGEPLHFFAVFDGHGGSHVSWLCKEWMHVLLAEELRVLGEGEWEAAMAKSFGRMDELALAGCEQSGMESEFVGSTSVVCLVSPDRVLVANCGDSRAVLSRSGRAVPLSHDHKPDRPDELARIEAAGGRVIHINGARVDGILAMSRAIGDKYLKAVVISEPEIQIVERTPEDEFLIIASDGLWDVLPNNLACDVARQCLEDAENSGTMEGGEQEESPRCSLAAVLLARLALGRKSNDNISVIVIDLRRA